MLTLLPSNFRIEESIGQEGHFIYESGHHGSLWLHLERLFTTPSMLRRWVEVLASQIGRAHV